MHYVIASADLYKSYALTCTQGCFIRWLFFTAIITAVIPLLWCLFVLMVFADWDDLKTRLLSYIELIAEGELYFFAITISATALNKLVTLSTTTAIATTTGAPNSDPSLLFVSVMLLLVLSTLLFSICAYSKLRKQGKAAAISSQLPKTVTIAAVSIIVAIWAVETSYQVYIFGGT